jgi:hypothetical protein
MEKYIAIAIGVLASNAIAIVSGGYLQYRFGHYVEPLIARVLSLLRKP